MIQLDSLYMHLKEKKKTVMCDPIYRVVFGLRVIFPCWFAISAAHQNTIGADGRCIRFITEIIQNIPLTSVAGFIRMYKGRYGEILHECIDSSPITDIYMFTESARRAILLSAIVHCLPRFDPPFQISYIRFNPGWST